jgi:predicted ferric reductase
MNLVALHQEPHTDNFTVLMIEIVFLGAMVPMAVTSYQRFRRRSHELFFSVHHVFLVVFLASSIHSWGSWLTLLPPLFMYIVNRAVSQYVVATANCAVVGVESVAGHTKLTLSCRPNHAPGQFVYLAMPSVSLVEWHPFSIASSTPDLLIIVKDMGPGTFTRALSAVAGKQACVDVLPLAFNFVASWRAVPC